uniref:Gamma-interferon-inducible lysosomal thiol reductase n=1 Tax=Amphora coffeiformis TaxID=265554 RepID=A0A7S3PAL8_9STRA|mmetsp:Transcript_24106/g.45838  ORF Transcript_24106/g.45838 Transcript_24106/m.45838 type:complete len:273 (+) Transcript_24106:57-875(+)
MITRRSSSHRSLMTSAAVVAMILLLLAIVVTATTQNDEVTTAAHHHKPASPRRSLMIDPAHKMQHKNDDDDILEFDDDDNGDNDADTKVSVQIYIEALCIDSKNYMLDEVVPTMESPLAAVMDLQIVVFGNSKLDTAARTVTCQHGAAECDADVYQQCAINNFIYPSRYVPFLACLFDTLPMGHAETPYDTSYFVQCAVHAALDFRALAACHAKDAWAMQVQAAALTPADHDHVPWVVIEGVYVDEDDAHLSEFICQALARKGASHAYCSTP